MGWVCNTYESMNEFNFFVTIYNLILPPHHHWSHTSPYSHHWHPAIILTIWSKSNANETIRPTTPNSHKDFDKCFIYITTFSMHMLIPNHVHINTQHIITLLCTKFHISIHLFLFFFLLLYFEIWSTSISFSSFLFFSSHQEFMLLGSNSQVLLLQIITKIFIFHLLILR